MVHRFVFLRGFVFLKIFGVVIAFFYSTCIYSAEANPGPVSPIIMFPGIQPALGPVPGNNWAMHDAFQNALLTLKAPNWNGTINSLHLSMLDATQLSQLAQAIREYFRAPGEIRFTEPELVESQWGGQIQGVRLDYIDLAIEIPFNKIGVEKILLDVDFARDILDGIQRKTQIIAGLSLGQAWKILGEFIDHYQIGLTQAKLLLTNAELAPAERMRVERLIEPFSHLFDKLSALYHQINTEFEKTREHRNMEILARNLDKFMALLRGQELSNFILQGGHDKMRPIAQIRDWVGSQPALAKLRVLRAVSTGTQPIARSNETAAPKTNAQILDRLLAVPGRAKAIAATIEQVGPGWAPPTLRLGNRLWNVFKLDDPEKHQYVGMSDMFPHQYSQDQYQFHQEIISPMEAKMDEVAKKLNLKDGQQIIVMRQPAPGRHVFRVARFNLTNGWHPHHGGHGISATFDAMLGLIELREAKQDDRTSLYDPLRIHGRNPVRGTMIEQRIHSVMTEHRVHQFAMLPDERQRELRTEVDRYNDERDQTYFEDQGLSKEMLTREEQVAPEDLSEERMRQLSHARAAKVSAELKNRQRYARAARLRTQGDDLRGDPALLMQPRVDELFEPNRIHNAQALSDREQQFYGENREGGYIDTVENAIAAQQEPFAPTTEKGVHFDAARVHHERIHQPGAYSVSHGSASHLAAPEVAYDSVTDALADYEAQNPEQHPQAYEPVSDAQRSADFNSLPAATRERYTE